jgi:hypothetical protein
VPCQPEEKGELVPKVANQAPARRVPETPDLKMPFQHLQIASDERGITDGDKQNHPATGSMKNR